MPRRSKKSKPKWALQKKLDKRIGLPILLFLGAILATGLPAFSAIGSDWAIDVSLDSVGYGSSIYDVGALPSSADVINSGNRLVTIDYDKSTRTGITIPVTTLDLGVWGSYEMAKATPTTTGLLPTVSHAVGNLFISDEEGNPSEVGTRYFEDPDGDDVGNLHYYFGFSVMFTTRGEVYYTGGSTGALVDNRDTGEMGWLTYTQVAPYRAIDVRSVVALNLNSLSSSFKYEGVLNSVDVVNTRARYTVAESISGTSSNLVTFNSDYDWLPHNMKGSAVESISPVIQYGVIDSESEKMATIELGATLAIGLDSPQVLPPFLQGLVGSGMGIALLNSLINPAGYDLAGPINVYNVEYIYDLVIDVSLNGMPIADYMGGYAAGTLDGLLAASEPEEGISIWIYVIVAVVAVIILRMIL